MGDYILEAAIENLQLLFGEVGLGFQLLEALWPVAHRRHLQLVICFIWREEEEEEEEGRKTEKKYIYYQLKTSAISVRHVLLPCFGYMKTVTHSKEEKSAKVWEGETSKNVIRQQKGSSQSSGMIGQWEARIEVKRDKNDGLYQSHMFPPLRGWGILLMATWSMVSAAVEMDGG